MKRMRRALSLLLALVMLLTLAGCGKSDYVKNAESLIAAIGEVDADSGEAIEAAEKAFAALTDEDKARVENADVLPEARAALELALEEKAAAELEALRQSVLGTWATDLDVDALLIPLLTSMLPENPLNLADYLNDPPIRMFLALKNNGTYETYVDEDSVSAYFTSLKGNLGIYYRYLLSYLIAENLRSNGYNISGDGPAHVEAVLGMSLDEYILRVNGQSLDEIVDQEMGDDKLDIVVQAYERSGRFTVEPGRLHISASTAEEPRENDYESFVLEGDTLTITDYAGTSALDLVYPLVFQRVS